MTFLITVRNGDRNTIQTIKIKSTTLQEQGSGANLLRSDEHLPKNTKRIDSNWFWRRAKGLREAASVGSTSYIIISVAHPTYPKSNLKHQPRHENVFCRGVARVPQV